MSLNDKSTFEVNKGSDLEFQFNWPNGSGGNFNLTGYTVDGYGVDPELVSRITITSPTPTDGLIRCVIQWDENIPLHRPLGFRIRITQGTRNITTNEMKVIYK